MEDVLRLVEQARKQFEKRRNSRPFVLLTWAQSLDGNIAAKAGATTVISCEATTQLTHHLRSQHEAILVGIGTVLADNPRLTARIPGGRSPIPVVLDSSLRTPPTCALLRIEREVPPLICVSSPLVDGNAADKLRTAGAEILSIPDAFASGGICLTALLEMLYARGIRSVMVEGGARILRAFCSEGVVDFVVVTIAPRILIGGLPALSEPTQIQISDIERIGASESEYSEDRTASAMHAMSSFELFEPKWTALGSDIVLSGAPTDSVILK